MEMKFDMDDPKGILSMLKYFLGHSRSLRGHYEVTSGFINYAIYEWSLRQSKHLSNMLGFIKGH